jgi:hypothetical protein
MQSDDLNWDFFPGWDDQAETEARPTSLLEPGTYPARVIKAEAGYRQRVPEKWSDTNPEGRQLTIKLAIKHAGEEHHIYVDLPAHFRGLIERVCDALSAPRPAKGTAWSTGLLVGKRCRVETSLYEGRRVNVDRWLPDDIVDSGRQPEAETPPPAAKKPAARTPAAKVAAAAGNTHGNTDDIPF